MGRLLSFFLLYNHLAIVFDELEMLLEDFECLIKELGLISEITLILIGLMLINSL